MSSFAYGYPNDTIRGLAEGSHLKNTSDSSSQAMNRELAPNVRDTLLLERRGQIAMLDEQPPPSSVLRARPWIFEALAEHSLLHGQQCPRYISYCIVSIPHGPFMLGRRGFTWPDGPHNCKIWTRLWGTVDVAVEGLPSYISRLYGWYVYVSSDSTLLASAAALSGSFLADDSSSSRVSQ
jgi:hypothetical protein